MNAAARWSHRTLSRQFSKTVSRVTFPAARVSASAPAAFPATCAVGGQHPALRLIGSETGLRQTQARFCNVGPAKTVLQCQILRGGAKTNWWSTAQWWSTPSRTPPANRPTTRTTEHAATTNAVHVKAVHVEELSLSNPVESVPTPSVEPLLERGSEGVGAGEVAESRGLKGALAVACGRITAPQATALCLVVVALTGFSFPLIKFVATAFDSSTILIARFLVAGVCLGPWVGVRDGGLVLAGAETAGWLAAGLAAQAFSLASGTSAGVCSFLASLSCVVCPFLATAAGHRLSPQSWVAAGLAVTGTGILCLGDLAGAAGLAAEGGGAAAGGGVDAFALLQPWLFGIYLFRTERRMAQHPGKAMELTALQCVLVCLLVAAATAAAPLLLAPAAGVPAVAAALPPVSEWAGLAGAAWGGVVGGGWCAGRGAEALGLLFLGVFSSAFVLAAQTVVVTRLKASKTSLLFATEPFFAAALAWALLGEGLGPQMVVGGGFATLACVTASSPRFYNALATAPAALARRCRPSPAAPPRRPR